MRGSFSPASSARRARSIPLRRDVSEVDLDKRVWTRPADHMKLRKVHRVPLSDAALEVFRSLAAVRIPGVDHIFAGASRGRRAGQLGPQALRRAMEKLGRRAYDPHGFRSTFSD